jgi:hypothetical protein
MKPAGDPTGSPPVLPTRLRLSAARGSALALGLGQAHARVPTDEQLQALERNVLAALGAAGAASMMTAAARAARTTAVAHPAAGFSLGGAKIVVALAVAVGAATGVWIWRQPAPAIAPPPGASVPAVAVTAPPVPPAAVVAPPPATARTPAGHPRRAASAAVTPAASAARGVAPPAAEPAPATPTAAAHDDTTEELRLLARAQKALALDPAFALTLAHEHRRRFPSGSMDQEREVIAVNALVNLGRTGEARERAEHFAREHAGSAYAARMQSILARAAAQP